MQPFSIFRWGRIMPFLILSLMAFSSCEEDSKTSDPTPTSDKKTGWKGSDDPSTIPSNLNNPFEGDPSTLPASVDLTAFFPPIGDQGQYGTCVAWAAGYNAKTALEAIKFNLTPTQLSSPAYQLSAKYLFTALPNTKKGENCNGTDFTPALDVMLDKGIATKSVVPYTDLGNCSENRLDAAWNTDAAKHKIKYYRKIEDKITTIKQALAAKMPVILGAKLDDSFMQWNSETVYQSHTSFTNVGIHSYHAMCIVGYDNNKGPRGAFKVVNSWGNQWGTGGFIWVDYNFMVNGFAFNKNFFVAVNDEQKPNPTDPPVVSSGVDLVPWIDSDYSDVAGTGFATRRSMEFDIYNIGNQAANASSEWGYAYIYYNAYDANNYGIVFYDSFKNQGAYKSITPMDYGTYTGLQINCNIPAQNYFSNELFDGNGLIRSYYMPTNLNGYYYLVMAVDITDKFEEQDESNNLFYTTDQYPKYFENGVGTRQNAAADAFSNPLRRSDIRSQKMEQFQTAVKAHNRNAYTPEEIIGFLKKEARNGNLAKKIAEARSNWFPKDMNLRSAKN